MPTLICSSIDAVEHGKTGLASTCLPHDKGWQRVWRNGDPCSYKLGQYLNYSRPNRSTQARQLQARSSSKMNLPRKENR